MLVPRLRTSEGIKLVTVRFEINFTCLEPGGYLQWVERDWMSKFPEKAEKSDDPHTQITCYHRSFFPKTRSVPLR